MPATAVARPRPAGRVLGGPWPAGPPLSRVQLEEIQRMRLLAGAVAAVEECGYQGATVGKITAHAHVSRRTFYELFANRDECLAAVLEDVVARVRRELDAAGAAELAWRERVRMGLLLILGFLDREPALARICVVDASRAGAAVQACRERVLAQLAAVVDEGREQRARGESCGPLTAEGLVGAAFAIVHARLSHREPRPLAELVGELAGMIVLPYIGTTAARRERERRDRPAMPEGQAAGMCSPRVSAPVAAGDPLQGVRMRVTYRTARVLEGVSELSREGARPSNRRIAAFAGIADPGQISKLLRRLERLGLIENHGGGHAQGEPNAWRLTGKGARMHLAITVPPHDFQANTVDKKG